MSQLYVQVQDVQHRIIYPYANARAGEHSLASTGQKSGLWKNLGRPPQQTAGVGFIAEGFETSRPIAACPAATTAPSPGSPPGSRVRLLSNVVDGFVRDGAPPGARWIAEETQWR